MKRAFLIAVLLVYYFLPLPGHAQSTVRHDLHVTIDPKEHSLRAVDRITLPIRFLNGGDSGLFATHFILHEGLVVRSRTAGVLLKKLPEESVLRETLSMDAALPVEVYRVILPKSGTGAFELAYEGAIHHPLRPNRQGYGQEGLGTAGTISPKGAFLGGATAWYPGFGDALVSFRLEVEVPAGWSAVSQGSRSIPPEAAGANRVVWEEGHPQEEIYLVAGPFEEFSRHHDGVEIIAYLRAGDGALAERYLAETGVSLGLYSDLIGPYPYAKFALVENFWETGYGMPSFTLLGSRVIRLPFILFSSYPHEILHNWWGNGVFVDDESGNWSEGLTTYLADHLFQERRGTGAAYRRQALEKYADYVSEGKDFPLTAFRSRHSGSTQAVGYGKTMMFFHMIRVELGDEAFLRGLRQFYGKNRFRRASFRDLQDAFESASGQSLANRFEQWVRRTGAPVLEVDDAAVSEKKGRYLLSAELRQTQPGAVYHLKIPIAVHLEGVAEAYQGTVRMKSKTVRFERSLPAKPLLLEVDPEFDLFRKLDRREVPPALSLAFGASRTLILLPSRESEALLAAYRRLAESWRASDPDAVEIRMDGEMERIPRDRSVWLLGWKNRWRDQMLGEPGGAQVSADGADVRIAERVISRKDESIVAVFAGPGAPGEAVVWLATERPEAVAGLARKVPHYGSYSYLVFSGDEPANILKGRWPVTESPLSVRLWRDGEPPSGGGRGSLAPRRSLAGGPEG